MQILAQQPCSIAKVLDTSFRLFAAGFAKVIGFGLIISLLYIALTLLSANLVAAQSTVPEQAQDALLETLPMLLAYTAVISLLSFILYAAMIYRFDNVVHQREDSFAEALGVGLKKFPGMLWASILYGLAVAGGTLLLVVPGVILMLSLALYPFFIVVEGFGGYAALKASHNLVWGNWWRTLTVYMAPGIIVVVFFFTFAFLAASVSGESDPGAVTPADLISNLLYAVVMPYFYALAYVVYHDLQLRKSGSDLAARLTK